LEAAKFQPRSLRQVGKFGRTLPYCPLVRFIQPFTMPNVSHTPREILLSGGGDSWLVVGFSVRALAEAVVALGGQPFSVDHFTDQDCRELACGWAHIKNWGKGWPELRDALTPLVQKAPGMVLPTRVLLGGGTENWLELIDELHQSFQVLGPTLDQLQQLRSSQFWSRSVENTAIAFPETYSLGTLNQLQNRLHNPTQASWLLKPVRGAGGLAIRRWESMSQPTALRDDRYVLQREIVGRPLGVYCILTPQGCQLLGVTESLTAEVWPGPSEFVYRGSWGPVPISSEQVAQIIDLATRIQVATGCVGWLQMDFIEDHFGHLWLLEINPRWAAGMEILMLAGINPVEHHLAAWKFNVDRPAEQAAHVSSVSSIDVSSIDERDYFGKAIVYADRDIWLTGEQIASLHRLPREHYADLPSAEMCGQLIPQGAPLLTVRARGEPNLPYPLRRQAIIARLEQLRDELRRDMGVP
jgi:predicted ATP-grasp superfamily ATP-dependent carboligase